MKYPYWLTAITTLEILKQRQTENDQSERERGHDRNKPNAESLFERFNQQMQRGLLDEESAALLAKLITDLNMKSVWITLSKHAIFERDIDVFFMACERGITGWIRDKKQTPRERRKSYQEIHDTAHKLQCLLNDASAFDCHAIGDLVDDRKLMAYIDQFGTSFFADFPAEKKMLYVHYYLFDIFPQISSVLKDIQEKANEYRDEPSIVKKPNSENAKIHYFIRILSEHCRFLYNQPLHKVVATTTSVIFDQPNIDEDYVRKIVKQ